MENGVCVVRICDEDGETARTAPQGEEGEYSLMALLFGALRDHTGKTPRWGMLTASTRSSCSASSPSASARRRRSACSGEVFCLGGKGGAGGADAPLAGAGHGGRRGKRLRAVHLGALCPTRCAYCSFVSQSVEKTKKQIPQYHALLWEEIRATADCARQLGLRLRAVYVGGGTPTTFSAEQLRSMLETVRASFDLSACTEFTVEAGRPDTIDREKLTALLESGVTRISINPQTLQDNVLENIGRRHTAQQTVEAFRLAREVGFTNINMDLIVGLPGDTYESFCDTIEQVLALDPENVTVHALALKRSSRITQSGEINRAHADAALADRMMAYAEKRLTEHGLAPYYLYRQSRMAGNLENTGWAKPGFVCAYNIFTMDETETVLACGAGGVSKLKDPYSEDLTRIFNFKYSYEYISRYGEILKRKEGIGRQYEQFRKRIR